MTTAVATREKEPAPLVQLKSDLEARVDDLRMVLPDNMDVDRFVRVSLIAISKNPELLACTRSSIIRSISEAAEVGLEPTGSLSRAWLAPFRNKGTLEAQLMIGYQGLADLMRDSGRVRRIWAECVYEGDEFHVVKGTTPSIVHVPAYQTEDPAQITHVYAVAEFNDGGQQFEVMTHQQVEGIRAKSRSANGPAWVQSWPQMARKTGLRRLANYVPLSTRAAVGIQADDEREFAGPAPSTVHAGNARVRALLAEKGVIPPTDAPGASETVEAPEDAAPDVSAAGQPETDGPAVCDATSDPALGVVEACELEAGHKKPHQSEAGSIWPNKP